MLARMCHLSALDPLDATQISIQQPHERCGRESGQCGWVPTFLQSPEARSTTRRPATAVNIDIDTCPSSCSLSSRRPVVPSSRRPVVPSSRRPVVPSSRRPRLPAHPHHRLQPRPRTVQPLPRLKSWQCEPISQLWIVLVERATGESDSPPPPIPYTPRACSNETNLGRKATRQHKLASINYVRLLPGKRL